MSAHEHLNQDQFVDYYHGTTSRQANLIRYTGLRSRIYNSQMGHPTLTTNKNEARRYAQDSAKYSESDSGVKDTGSIVHLRVHKSYVTHPERPLTGLKNPIPKHMVKGVKEI